jgi:gluconokinase
LKTWADLSGAGAAAEARRAGFSGEYYRRTGCVLHGMYPCWKLAAIRGGENTADDRARYISTQLEYLYEALTGEAAVSTCLASGSGLLNVDTLEWDDMALKAAGLNKGMMGYLKDIYYMGELSARVAAEVGLQAGLPVSVGQSDGALNQLAVGGMDGEIMSMSVGTSGALRRSTPSPKLSAKPSTWCYNISKNAWIAGAAVNNATNCVDWLLSTLRRKPLDAAMYDEMSHSAALINSIKAPIFLPFIFGERCPGWQEARRGGFVGLDKGHGEADMYYAVLEGIVFNMYQCYGVLKNLTGPPSRTVVSGGITRSSFWMQLAADTFGMTLTTTGTQNDSTVGAALVAIAALEGGETIEPAKAEGTLDYEPNTEKHCMLMKRYSEYLQMYAATSPESI